MRTLLACIAFLFFSYGCNEAPPADNRTEAPSSESGKADSGWFFYDDEGDWNATAQQAYRQDAPVLHDDTVYLTLDIPTSCQSPCVFHASPSIEEVTTVQYEADGILLGTSYGPDFSMTYAFNTGGERHITAFAYMGNDVVATASSTVWVSLGGPECGQFASDEEDQSPIQITGSGAPAGAWALNWVPPSEYIYIAPFKGQIGNPAVHEGQDNIHPSEATPYVPVHASADGTVAYVRSGCPQSSMFTKNLVLRECGSGWGNHLLIDHGNGIHTRYAHLAPGTITVQAGDTILAHDILGEMGNTGRSETRHLHFELGVASNGFDPCAPSQSLDTVYDPASVGL